MFFRKFAALTLLCLLVLVQRSSAQAGASARIFFVDIGQGAGTLIVSPVGGTLLMDGGPGGGGTKIGALLTALGIGTIDHTVVSHYHIDHISGITELINAGRVNGIAYDVGDGVAVEPPFAGGTRTAFLNYRTAATTAPGVSRQTLTPGTVIDIGGGMTVTAMAAAGHLLSGASIPITTEDLNSESISLLVQYNNFDFVVAGDLSGGGSTSTNKTPDVESYVGQMIGDVDVVQLSHHGSTTTTSQMYLSAIRAELALAQASENNTFGHPNREPVNKFLNTPNTNGTTFGGTTVPPAGVPPLFYQTQASRPDDDRVTRQAHTGAAFGNAGNGTLELVTDGTTFYTMSSRDDGGVRIPAGIHSYAVDGAGAGVTTNFAPTVLVTTSPVVPLSTDSVTVSAAVNNREDVVATVTLAYTVNGVAQAPVPMLPAGGVYQATIPAQANGARVDYAVSALAGMHTTTYSLGYFSGVTPVSTLKALNANGEPLYFDYPARINATVTAGTGTFATSGANDDYLQDETGGINLWRTVEPAVPATQPTTFGQVVEARGRLAFNGGRHRLDLSPTLGGPPTTPLGVTLISSGADPTPQPVTIAQLNANPEAFEGQFVSIVSASIVSGSFPTTTQQFDTFVTISDGTGDLLLKIDDDTDVDGFNPGTTFPVAGIFQQDDFLRPFNAGYNITPRSRVDLGGDPTTAPLVTIAEAEVDQVSNSNGSPGADFVPDLLGQFVRVRGAVTSIDFRGGAGVEYYIQDSTGGTTIFNTGSTAGPFNIGDSVEAVGLVTQFNGLTEVDPGPSPANFTLLAPGTIAPATPQVVTIAQLIAQPGAESLEGRLVRINNVSTSSTGNFPVNNNITITDSTGSMVLRTDGDTDIDGTPIPSGTFSVIGLASQFDGSAPMNSGYQILPRSTVDLLPGTPASLTVSPSPITFGAVNVGSSSPVTATITNVSSSTVMLTTPFTITGTNADQFSVGAPGTTTLSAGANTTATVTFLPTSADAKSATLNVTAAGGVSVAVALSGTGQTVAPPGTPLVISEFRFRGTAGAADEFVEIYNNTDAAISIAGFKLKGSNSGGVASTRATVGAGVSIPARGHFLFVGATYSGAPVGGNQTFGTGITDDGGAAFTDAADVILDQVGLSPGSLYKEGTTLASLGTSNLNRSYERKPGGASGSTTDTDNNAADFVLRTPSDPQNLSSAPTPSCGGITVNGAPPAGSTSTPYSTIFTASGGTPPFAFSSTGSVPPGLTLASDGTLSGTPNAAGTFNFSVVATDSIGCAANAPFSVAITGVANLTATSVDFGIVGTTGSNPQFVVVTNNSGFPVTLTPPFTTSGADATLFSAASVSPTIAAGGSANVAVTFSPDSDGAKAAVLTITSNSSGAVDVELTGTGAAKLASAALVISEFRFRGPGGASDEFIEIYNPTDGAIEISGYRLLGSNNAGVNSTRATVPAGRFVPPYGHYLFANNAYTGTTAGDQSFGTGITDDGGVALARPDGFIVDAAGASAGSVFKEGTPLASLGTAATDRSYERLPGGFDGASVDTDINRDDFALRDVSAPQNSSSPSTPSMALSPAAVDFGAIAAGTSTSSPVTIDNIGGTTITFATPFTITGDNAADFSVDAPADAEVAPGASTSVTVTFSPASVGARSATLNIATTDGESRTVALSGNGICPLITVNGAPAGGQYGSPYSHFFTASGGLAPYLFTTAGPVPAGLTLSGDGQLSGTPTAAGSVTFDVQALDANGCAATATVSLTIARAALSVVADNATREYGEANPVFTGTITGAIAGDGLSASFASAATPSSVPGTYPIVATINDPLGRLANYSVTVANGTLTITDASTPGLMLGKAGIDTTNVDYDLEFRVRERSSGAEAGHVRFDVTTKRRGRDETHRFRSTQVDEVSFLDTPGTTPGRRPASGIDSVLFTGRGTWDGGAGYWFEARATDAGEPGHDRDSFAITIRDALGAVVATIDGVITKGNIQSLRTR